MLWTISLCISAQNFTLIRVDTFPYPKTAQSGAAPQWLGNFKKYEGNPITPAKSAAILDSPIDGKYWLYFGDTNIWTAYSTDLIHWSVIKDPVIKPREGFFDEALCEPGLPPILTENGILLIYNVKIPEERAKELGEGMVRQYSTGWVGIGGWEISSGDWVVKCGCKRKESQEGRRCKM